MEKIRLPKLFNKSEIARAMFPNNVDAPAHLLKKLNGQAGQSVNEQDKKKIIDFAESELKKLKNILK